MGKGDNKAETVEAPKRRGNQKTTKQKEILFAKDNYMVIGVGLVLVIIGLFLMSGGYNQPDEWKAEEIYSFTRITLAPMIILGGLGVVIMAIFKSSGKEEMQNIEA
ncbi:DUF3098 domain-containing protein [Aureispira anguillae]|uniref:DUF3098 domain-containing protein n=1 Tax=Aureispira anguillae TaxID=2864201 RepID=A0A916DTL6_9BACT|nr:DUF3098 domain-containing protein [Aureispira anguillae]BDS11892.1 DUF3098 domain-containing protein [Aureispira anguillae]